MPAEIKLTITKGMMSGKSLVCNEKALLILGRMDDCALATSDNTVSRYHCLIEIAPPSVMVRDFGSLNGTYLNGKKIGQREKEVSAEEAWKANENEGSVFEVKSGDRLGLGPDCEITIEVKTDKGEETRNANRSCEVCGSPLPSGDGPGICEPCQKDAQKVLDFVVKKQAHDEVEGAMDIAGYRRIRELGRGGMGQVWLVEKEATGKQMALKLMLPQVAASEHMWVNFMREACISGQLNHKNIVKQHECGRLGNVFFMTMELCKGGNVDDLIAKKGGKLDIDLATHIMLQVLDGLAYAHDAPLLALLHDGTEVKANGVVHRDFKPGNVFLTSSSKNLTAKIGDFGLAKSFETAGLSGLTYTTDGASGTPFFMPRQQIINFRYAKPPVDVWAAAASYYYMLTGNVPKNFSKRSDPFSIALKSDAIPIMKRNPSIPKKLAEVIDHALREKPDIGVQSATELKKMITGAL
jgi:pSer/pThr/pTyr-binding forkhead associated (FHA) protein